MSLSIGRRKSAKIRSLMNQYAIHKIKYDTKEIYNLSTRQLAKEIIKLKGSPKPQRTRAGDILPND